MLWKGVASAFMLRSEHAPEMTAEQQIRGRDASVDQVLLATGYSPELMAGLGRTSLAHARSKATARRQWSSRACSSSRACPPLRCVFQLACLSTAALRGPDRSTLAA
jgi:hypothetical protein